MFDLEAIWRKAREETKKNVSVGIIKTDYNYLWLVMDTRIIGIGNSLGEALKNYIEKEKENDNTRETETVL